MENQLEKATANIAIWDIPISYHPATVCCCPDELEQKIIKINNYKSYKPITNFFINNKSREES